MKREQIIKILEDFGNQIIGAERSQCSYPPEDEFADRIMEHQPQISEEEVERKVSRILMNFKFEGYTLPESIQAIHDLITGKNK